MASDSQVSTNLGGESVILGLDSELYYSLDSVGTRVWGLLQQPRSVSSIRDELLKDYKVDTERCEDDLMKLLCELAEHGLVTVGADAR